MRFYKIVYGRGSEVVVMAEDSSEAKDVFDNLGFFEFSVETDNGGEVIESVFAYSQEQGKRMAEREKGHYRDESAELASKNGINTSINHIEELPEDKDALSIPEYHMKLSAEYREKHK